MNAFLIYSLLIVELISFGPKIQGNSAPKVKESSADIAWKRILAYTGYSDWEWEGHCVQMRKDGIKFWKDYPNDPRRYEWLLSTIKYAPHYFKDINQVKQSSFENWYKIPIDRTAKVAWGKQYLKLRTEFWKDPKVTDKDRCELWRLELCTELNEAYYRAYYAHAKIDVTKLRQGVLTFAAAYPNYWHIRYPGYQFFWNPKVLGLGDPKKMLDFLAPMKKSPNLHLAEYALGKGANVQTRPNAFRF